MPQVDRIFNVDIFLIGTTERDEPPPLRRVWVISGGEVAGVGSIRGLTEAFQSTFCHTWTYSSIGITVTPDVLPLGLSGMGRLMAETESLSRSPRYPRWCQVASERPRAFFENLCDYHNDHFNRCDPMQAQRWIDLDQKNHAVQAYRRLIEFQCG